MTEAAQRESFSYNPDDELLGMNGGAVRLVYDGDGKGSE
jgi:hypothetical protein